MRQVITWGLGLCLLASCGTTITPVIMTTTVTSLPTSVAAGADLTIGLQVVNGCAVYTDVSVLERTANKLSLQVNGKKTDPCPNVLAAVAQDISYVDKGTPQPRQNTFEVWVNGNKVGTVTVQ